jgi:murein DD-endopeptidase MepM/ murein hydrolase activator NlpD
VVYDAWDWSFLEDGALAIDSSETWLEPTPSPRLALLQIRASAAASELQDRGTSVTVPRMPSPRAPGQARRTSKARAAARRRARRIAGLIAVSIALVVTFLLTAFGSGSSSPTPQTRPASANRFLPAGQPRPQVVALRGSLRLQLPIDQSRVTAIGYHAAGGGALALEPVGRQANEGLFARMARKLFGGGEHGLTYYQLGGDAGPSTAALDVGAAVGTDVYAPVDGTIVGVTPYTLRGQTYGARIDVQPTSAPALVVRVTHLRPDPALTVGSSVAAGISKIGTLIDFSEVEKQALARYTQDAGNHASFEVHPAASLAIP